MNDEIRDSMQTDANREFESSRQTSVQWFAAALIFFMIVDYVYLHVLKWG